MLHALNFSLMMVVACSVASWTGHGMRSRPCILIIELAFCVLPVVEACGSSNFPLEYDVAEPGEDAGGI